MNLKVGAEFTGQNLRTEKGPDVSGDEASCLSYIPKGGMLMHASREASSGYTKKDLIEFIV